MCTSVGACKCVSDWQSDGGRVPLVYLQLRELKQMTHFCRSEHSRKANEVIESRYKIATHSRLN
jgi:hypothetical protein